AEGPQRFSVTCCYRGVGVAGRFVSGATGPAKTQQKEVCYFFFEPFFDDDFLVVFLELDFLAMHVTSFLGKHSKGEKICRQRFFESPAENFPRARRCNFCSLIIIHRFIVPTSSFPRTASRVRWREMIRSLVIIVRGGWGLASDSRWNVANSV